jgi:HEPN domain-containing protein
MITEDQKYIVYGLSPIMQNLIKAGVNDLRTHSMTEVLNSISHNCSLSQDEKNLVMFELGREYERKKYVG